MSSLLKNIAKMQIMLADMEAEFGIRDIGAIEKSVLSSVADLAGDTTSGKHKGHFAASFEQRLLSPIAVSGAEKS